MEKISTQLIQAQSYVAILTQSSDGMVQMTARMIEQALKGIAAELKSLSRPEPVNVPVVGKEVKAPEGRPIAAEIKPKHPAAMLCMPEKRKAKGSERRLIFSYGAYVDDDRMYTTEEMAELFGVTKSQFYAVLKKHCSCVKHDGVKGKRLLLYKGKSVKKIREILKGLYGYNTIPATDLVVKENLPKAPDEDSYLHEYCEKKRIEAAKANPHAPDPEWPDPMPASIRDLEDEQID